MQRTLEGNWTFLVVTDRINLDDQIYKTFARAGVLTEPEEQVRAQSGQDLRVLLTLIQKFRTEGGEEYPQLSDRSDVIVRTDEAHRSQYDVFAGNMRAALPQERKARRRLARKATGAFCSPDGDRESPRRIPSPLVRDQGL
nr:DEAD/DEAH box helicase family protein [Salinibacter altiplanensis]